MARWRHAALLALAPAAVGAGVGSVAVARHAPSASFAGRSLAYDALELAAGWSLCAAGAALAFRRRIVVGVPFVGAGIAWFASEWANPGVGSGLVFTTGLVVPLACAPLVAHASLAYPSGHLSAVERTTLAAGYLAAVGFAGVLPAATFDPAATGCFACPGNLLFVGGAPGLHAWLERWGLRLALVVVAALGLLLARRAVRSSVPAVAYLAVVAAGLWHDAGAGTVGTDATDLRLWRVEAVALLGVASVTGWSMIRSLRARRSLARLAIDLGRSAARRSVGDRLSATLGDPGLRVFYRWSGGEGLVDAEGADAEPVPAADEAVTRVQRDGRELAVILHRMSLLDDPGLVEDVVAAVRLELENERHEADVRAQLRTLQASRARIVASADRARQRLERDLHDGAQQRFVGISLALRLLRTAGAPPPALEQRLDAADAELRATLADLRAVAHGIFPAVLEDEGLQAALEQLAAASPADVTLRGLPAERFDPAVESAAYFVVAETVKQAAYRASVAARRAGAELVVDVQIDAPVGRPPHRPRRPRRRAERDGARHAHDRWLTRARGAAVRIAIADDAMLIREGLDRASDGGRPRGGRQGRRDGRAAAARRAAAA